MTEALMTRQLRITGRVQGVGYRAAFAREAQRLQLSGWVRNRLDGTVEALVRGSADALDTITAWAKQGPRLARIDGVTVNDRPSAAVLFDEFRILPTE